MKKNLMAIVVDDEICDVASPEMLDGRMEEWKRWAWSDNLKAQPLSDFIKSPDSDIEKQVCEFLNACNWYHDVYTYNGLLAIEIIWGDWKHDHLAVDELVEKAFGLTCISKVTTEEDGSDCYSAIHYYKKIKEEEK